MLHCQKMLVFFFLVLWFVTKLACMSGLDYQKISFFAAKVNSSYLSVSCPYNIHQRRYKISLLCLPTRLSIKGQTVDQYCQKKQELHTKTGMCMLKLTPFIESIYQARVPRTAQMLIKYYPNRFCFG